METFNHFYEISYDAKDILYCTLYLSTSLIVPDPFDESINQYRLGGLISKLIVLARVVYTSRINNMYNDRARERLYFEFRQGL